MMTHSGWLLVCFSSEGPQAPAAWLQSAKKLPWKGASKRVLFPGTQLASMLYPALEMTVLRGMGTWGQITMLYCTQSVFQ